MKTDQSRVQSLLRDTITLLCRNSLHFNRELKVQGLLGVTMDDNSIFIVHIDESFQAGFNEMSSNENEADDVDYGKVELVESITMDRPDIRKRMTRGPGRIRNAQKNQPRLEADSGENYKNDFATSAVDFVDNSTEQTVFENHLRISAIKTDFSCEEDVKPFKMTSTDSKVVCHQLLQGSLGHVQDRLWGQRPSHESLLKSNVIKNELYPAADSSQFTTGGLDLAIIIPDENFDEMDELFVDGSDDLGYAANQDHGYLHSAELNESDTGDRTATRARVPPAFDQSLKPGTAQCGPKSNRMLGRSSFNSSNIWKVLVHVQCEIINSLCDRKGLCLTLFSYLHISGICCYTCDRPLTSSSQTVVHR